VRANDSLSWHITAYRLDSTTDAKREFEVGEMGVLQALNAGHEPRDSWSWPSPPDPGDLSRRIIQRRTELRLSIHQVAERAHLSRRYLEYLELFPARPSGTVLRKLAAALRTTPAALLGAGGDMPPGHGRPAGPRMEQLTQAECSRLIAPGGIGRIAMVTVTGPVILPVNFAVIAGTIVIRTEAGSVIAGHASEPVAFEVDHIDEALAQGWSVLVRGQAHPVLQPGERRNVQAGAALQPWPQGEHDLYIRIVPDRITGRRLTGQ
jgi:nitroimidazol reductase NimA-like FMN-containing flavoprotein (pyridoxamine 5'-phosphate oxidase superfamily)